MVLLYILSKINKAALGANIGKIPLTKVTADPKFPVILSKIQLIEFVSNLARLCSVFPDKLLAKVFLILFLFVLFIFDLMFWFLIFSFNSFWVNFANTAKKRTYKLAFLIVKIILSELASVLLGGIANKIQWFFYWSFNSNLPVWVMSKYYFDTLIPQQLLCFLRLHLLHCLLCFLII